MKFVLRYYPSPWIRFHWRWWLHWLNLRSLARFVSNCTVKREYLKLTLDGAWCIMTPADACDSLQDADDPKAYKIEPVWMTPLQYDRLPEFQGW